MSSANDSFVSAPTFDDLVNRLNAVRLWTRDDGFEDFGFPISGDLTFEAAGQADFIYTSLPEGPIAEAAWHLKIKNAEAQGLPVQPYLGDELTNAAAFVSGIIRNMVFRKDELGKKGAAKNGWTVDLCSEYDCQNLFSPWSSLGCPTSAGKRSP